MKISWIGAKPRINMENNQTPSTQQYKTAGSLQQAARPHTCRLNLFVSWMRSRPNCQQPKPAISNPTVGPVGPL